MPDSSNIDNADAPQLAAANPAADVVGAENLETVLVAPGLGPEVAQADGGIMPDLTLLKLEELLNLDPTDDSSPAGSSLETEPLQAAPEDGELPADLTSLDLDQLLELVLDGAELPTLLEVAGLSSRGQENDGEQNGPPDGAKPSTDPLLDEEKGEDDELGSEDEFGLEASLNSAAAAPDARDPGLSSEDLPGNNGQGNIGDSGLSNGPDLNGGQGNGTSVEVASNSNAGGNSDNVDGGSVNGNAGGNSANAGGSANSNAGGNSDNAGGGSANGNAGGNSANAGGGSVNGNAGGNSANAGGGSANGNAGGNSANAGGGSVNGNAGANSANAGGASVNGNAGGSSANSNAGSNAGTNSGSGAGAIAVAAAGISFPGGGELPASITPADIAPAAPASPPASVPAGPPVTVPPANSAATYVPSSESNVGPGNSAFGHSKGAAPDNTSTFDNPPPLGPASPSDGLPPTAAVPDAAGSNTPNASTAGLTLTGSGGSDSLVGGDNADDLSGIGGSDTLEGGAGADTLSGGGGSDLLDGGAGADILSGGGGADVLVWDFNDINIDGGGGNDTLRVDSGGADITTFGGTITGIENVDLLSDANANTLTLSAQDVLDMSGTDKLTVSGDALDSLDAGSGWTDGGVSGGNHTYTQVVGLDTATLVVDTDVTVNANILV